MALKVIQSINFEVKDGKKIIFTTDCDRKVLLAEFEECFSAKLDVPNGTTLKQLELGGIEEVHNLYFIATAAVKIRLVTPGLTKDDVPDMELVPDTPSFVGVKLSEVWIANDLGDDSLVTILATGKNVTP
jgi:hypothetical protein